MSLKRYSGRSSFTSSCLILYNRGLVASAIAEADLDLDSFQCEKAAKKLLDNSQQDESICAGWYSNYYTGL